ncbi:unnamed protein product [Cuscuta epithymum]|nr:unnamed protein product [Cuscuta epithymum]
MTSATPSRGNSSMGGQHSGSYASTMPRCRNCKKNHTGTCRDPPKCYQCGEAGHMKMDCPQIGKNRGSRLSGATTASRNRDRAPHASIGHGGASTSNAPSMNQGRTQARVYAMTEADAQANPDSVAVSGRT